MKKEMSSKGIDRSARRIWAAVKGIPMIIVIIGAAIVAGIVAGIVRRGIAWAGFILLLLFVAGVTAVLIWAVLPGRPAWVRVCGWVMLIPVAAVLAMNLLFFLSAATCPDHSGGGVSCVP